MARINILKQVKVDGRWKLVSIPKTADEKDDWKALPEGRYSACDAWERTLFTTFFLTGFREMEVVHLTWPDVNFHLSTIKVTAKPDLGFSPKRWEEREVPAHRELLELLRQHPRRERCRFCVPLPGGQPRIPHA